MLPVLLMLPVLALLSLATVRAAAGSRALAVTGGCVAGALGLIMFASLGGGAGERGGAVSEHAGAAVAVLICPL